MNGCALIVRSDLEPKSRTAMTYVRTTVLLVALTLGLAACDGGGTAPDDTTPPQVGSSPAIGAVYPNAADSRIILVNKAGTRFVYWTPSSGAFSDAEAVSTLENGALPLDDIGATSSTPDGDDTYFFSEDGTVFTVYERETSAFDEVEEFGEDGGEFGDPEIEDVGAAVNASSTQLLLFNLNGTRYGVWNEANE